MTEPNADRNVDVEAMHRPATSLPLRREAAEPSDGEEPTPWWMWTIAVSALFVGGIYLGRHFGSFSAQSHIGFKTSRSEQQKRPELARAATGAELYDQRCASCHQPDGRGLPGTYPPLVNSEWVTGRPEIPVRIVLLGLSGPLEVAGATYNGQMPTWGGLMSDAEIASVLTHVRSLSAAAPIDAELVARARAATAGSTGPLTADALRQLAKELR